MMGGISTNSVPVRREVWLASACLENPGRREPQAGMFLLREEQTARTKFLPKEQKEAISS